jgi:RNA polymerase sigma-70 factor (ECF subfamily)
MLETSESFHDLLARVRSGDEAALMALVAKYEPRVRMAAHCLLGPHLRRHLDSIDLVQSVNCVLVGGLKQGRFDLSEPNQLVALAVAIVRRKVAQHWRRVRRQQHAASSERGFAQAQRRQAEGDTMSVIDRRLDLERFRRLLDDTERRFVELRLQGYTTTEASAEMGIAANVLRVMLSRLRRRLRSHGLLADWI